MWLLIGCWLLYFFIHSFLAHRQVKRWVGKRAPFLLPFYRLLYNVFALGGFLAIWLYQRSLVETSLWESQLWHFYLGVGIVLLGGILGGFSLLNYDVGEFAGKAQLEGRSLEDPGKLKTGGLNAYVRHPLYFATLLVFWGYFLWKATDVALVLAILMSAYVIVGSILEERKLVEAFGEDYKQYQKEVAMLIPFLI